MHIKVTVTALAKKERISKVAADTFLISVKERADAAGANARVCSILSGMYVVAGQKPRVRIISGHSSANKVIKIDTAKVYEKPIESLETNI